MQPQLEDSVTPKSESRYRKPYLVTRFRDVKLPKPAEALQWHLWFCSLVLCAFRRKKAEHWGFLSSAEMEARLCHSLFDTGLTPEFRILLPGRTDTCHELNQACCRQVGYLCSQPWLYKYTDTPSQCKGSSFGKGDIWIRCLPAPTLPTGLCSPCCHFRGGGCQQAPGVFHGKGKVQTSLSKLVSLCFWGRSKRN